MKPKDLYSAAWSGPLGPASATVVWCVLCWYCETSAKIGRNAIEIWLLPAAAEPEH